MTHNQSSIVEEIRSLIARHAFNDPENAFAGQERLMAQTPSSLVVITIDRPFRTYDGPTMFDAQIMPTRLVRLLGEFIDRYGNFETHFYADQDYKPPLREYHIQQTDDIAAIRAFRQLPAILPSSSIRIFDMLPEFIIEAYCASLNVDPDDLMPYDEMMEAKWDEVLGILETTHDDRDEPQKY